MAKFIFLTTKKIRKDNGINNIEFNFSFRLMSHRYREQKRLITLIAIIRYDKNNIQ